MVSHSESKITGKLAPALVAGGLIWSVLGMPVLAEQLSQQQIFEALTDKHKTRSLSLGDRPAQSQEDLNFVESLRHRSNRSLSLPDRDHVAAIVKERPAVDLE